MRCQHNRLSMSGHPKFIGAPLLWAMKINILCVDM